MAISSRNTDQELMLAIAKAHNALQDALSQSLSDGYFHRDLTQTTSSPIFTVGSIVVTPVVVSAANATSLPTSITLSNQLFGILNQHMSDGEAHLKSDGVNLQTLDGYQTQLASNLSTVEVLLNALKVIYNKHLTQAGVHQNNDTTNTVSTANATDQTTANALANALKTALNAHMGSAPVGMPRINVVSP